MKIIVAAFAVAIASPAVAQPAPAQTAPGQTGPMQNHAAHGQQPMEHDGHGQPGRGHDCPCCADRPDCDCCPEMERHGAGGHDGHQSHD
jgi:hypothetical protein